MAAAALFPSTGVLTRCRYYGPNNLAEFSSLGPAFDGRMKPDIVAPGVNIMSANSDANMCKRDAPAASPSSITCTRRYSFQCRDSFEGRDKSRTLMSGTSMATPIAAGAAALVRQCDNSRRVPTAHVDANNWRSGTCGRVGTRPVSPLLIIQSIRQARFYER